MKKLFLFLTAVLFTTSLWGASVEFVAGSSTGQFNQTTTLTSSPVTLNTNATGSSASSRQIWKDGGSGKNETAIQLSSNAGNDPSTKYIEVTVAAGYKITGLTVRGAINSSSSAGTYTAFCWAGAYSTATGAVTGTGSLAFPNYSGTSDGANVSMTGIVDGTRTIRIYKQVKYNSSTKTIGNVTDAANTPSSAPSSLNVAKITVTYEAMPTHTLSPAVDPSGKGTVTLGATSVSEGATTTATYSAIDAAYEFDEWQISGTGASIDDASANPVTITMGTANATITLKLKEKTTKYAIAKGTHDNGDFTISPAEQAEGEKVTLNATPNTGYVLSAWEVVKTSDGSATGITVDGNNQFTMPAYAVTVNATFEALESLNITHNAAPNGSYTIKVGDAEAVSTNTTAYEGQSVTLEATPNSGYKFGAWDVYKTGDESTKVSVTNNSFTMPAYAVTISATFDVILYTVTYNVNGGGSVSPSSEEQASAGASVTLPTPTWSGYTFDGWYNAGTKIGDADDEYTPTTNITLYAKWTDNIDGKLFSYVDGNYGDKFQAFDGSGFVSGSANPEKDKTFTHATTGVQFIVDDGAWDKKNNAISALAKFKGGTSKMSVVIPAGKIATVKILYGAYGTGDDYKLTVNTTAQAAPVTKFADDHTNVQILSDMREVTLSNQTGTLTLGISNTSKNNYIGRVSATITGYVITYAKGSAEGATGDSFTDTKTAGSDLTLSDDDDVFTREGYIHAGWSTSADGSTKTYDFGGSYTTDAAITLYPYWAAISGITYNNASNGTYTIQVGDEEAVSESTTAVEGQTITLAVTSTDEGYRFNGWTVSKAVGTVPVNNNQFTMPAEAVSVSAAFVKVYTISFDANGGTGSAPAAIEPKAEGETFEVPANTFTAPEGKTFDKWNDGTNDYAPEATYTVGTANVTLTAVWKDNGGGTALDNTAADAKAVKRLENGMLIIEKNGKTYNVLGTVVK